MVSGEVSSEADRDGGQTYATAFLPMEQFSDGTVKPLSAKEAARMKGLGFGPVGAVRTEVIRYGSKVTHLSGYEFYLAAGLPPAFREVVTRLITPVLVDEMLENFYTKVNATKDEIRTDL
jgi:hypothetical protein